MKMILAVNKLNYLGKEGKMMWRSKEDFKHFKNATMGCVLLVGKTTYEQDLKSKPLEGREMIVIGTGYNTLFSAVEQAIKSGKSIWVIGGVSIYNQLLPLVEEIHISHIDNNTDIGDVQFFIPENFRGNVTHYYFEAIENGK